MTRSRTLVVLGASVLSAAAAAAPASAETQTFGSSLAAPANLVEAHQADTAFWQSSLASPADGQVRSVRIKGRANSDPKAGVPGGETMWHLQALRRLADGSHEVIRTSQPFFVPHTGDAQQISSYAPDNFCISQGDVLAFNTVGGWDGVMTADGPYPHGTPLQIFSRVAGSTVSAFEGADRTNNGDRLTPASRPGEELLMQATVGSGTDAATHCPGGKITSNGTIQQAAAAPRAQKVTIPKQRVGVTRAGSISVSLFCLPGSGPCQGRLEVLSTGSKKRKRYGSRSFTIAAKSNGKARLRLNAAGRRAFKKARSKLEVRLQVVTDPGGADRSSAFNVVLRRRGKK